jgi:hypothetical protein
MTVVGGHVGGRRSPAAPQPAASTARPPRGHLAPLLTPPPGTGPDLPGHTGHSADTHTGQSGSERGGAFNGMPFSLFRYVSTRLQLRSQAHRQGTGSERLPETRRTLVFAATSSVVLVSPHSGASLIASRSRQADAPPSSFPAHAYSRLRACMHDSHALPPPAPQLQCTNPVLPGFTAPGIHSSRDSQLPCMNPVLPGSKVGVSSADVLAAGVVVRLGRPLLELGRLRFHRL